MKALRVIAWIPAGVIAVVLALNIAGEVRAQVNRHVTWLPDSTPEQRRARRRYAAEHNQQLEEEWA